MSESSSPVVPSHPAVLVLAKRRDALLPDHDGHLEARKKLIDQFTQACQHANLHLGSDRDGPFVSFWHPPPARVFLNPGAVELDPAFASLVYDPLRKEFAVTDPKGPDALTIFAEEVGKLLEEKTKAKQPRI